MIFKKAYRKVEFSDDYTLEELSGQINKIFNSKLYSTIYQDRIIIHKKFFSDCFPFNFGHLGSIRIHAKSIKTESNSKNREFVIEMNYLSKFSIYGTIFVLFGYSIFMFLNYKIWMACGGLIFIIIVILLNNVMHSFGIANFMKNWDKHIGTKI